MSPEYSEKIKFLVQEITRRYPSKEAALLPVLHAFQNETGHISAAVENQVADLLEISPVKVREVVSFYTMYNRKPVGKYHIQVCSNLSCTLLGSEAIVDYLSRKLGIGPGETTPDKKFTLTTVECLGACEQAPCMMVNFEYHGHLDTEKIDQILTGLE